MLPPQLSLATSLSFRNPHPDLYDATMFAREDSVPEKDERGHSRVKNTDTWEKQEASPLGDDGKAVPPKNLVPPSPNA
jgi:hypothetical protein